MTELADLFCRDARRRIDAWFHALWGNEDAFKYRAAQHVLDGRHLWLEGLTSAVISAEAVPPAIAGPAVNGEAEESRAAPGSRPNGESREPAEGERVEGEPHSLPVA